MTEYLRTLAAAAQQLPSLSADLQRASTIYSLQECTQQVFNLLSNVIYHLVVEAQASGGFAAPAPTPAQVAVPKPAPVRPAYNPIPCAPAGLPPLPVITQPSMVGTPPTGPMEAQGAVIQKGVTNVVVGSQGTTVISPDGIQTVLPPGEPVDLSASTGRPPEPPPAPPGVASIVLPPGGGGMTPDVMAALAGRSQDTPMVSTVDPRSEQ